MADVESRLARAVLSQNLKVRPGENVLIESWTHGLPYARAFVEEARRLRARPTVLYEDERAWWNAVESKQLSSFRSLSAVERAALAAADVYVYIWGPEDRPRRDRLPESIRERLVGYNPEWYRRASKAGVRGCRLTLGQATDPVAASFDLDGPRWRRRLAEAGSVNSRRMQALGDRVARAIQKGKELRIRHPNGTDLRIPLARVHTRVDAGLLDAAALKRPFGMLANNPTGQVFVAWDGADANGTFVSNRTVYVGPNRFGGVRWVFRHGRLVKHSCATGGALFRKQYASAPKGKDRLGYLSIGLNAMGRDLPPCEDTEEGAAIVGIGGNAFAGGRNAIPFQGFALVGRPTIEVDGVTIASGGRIRAGSPRPRRS
jgi:leucyl aminopeptidase (aminopeptidase T)